MMDGDLLNDEQSLLPGRGGDVDLHALLVLALERVRGDDRRSGGGGSLVGLLGVLGCDDACLVATRRRGSPALRQRIVND